MRIEETSGRGKETVAANYSAVCTVLHRPRNTFHDTVTSVSNHNFCSLSPQCQENMESRGNSVMYAGLIIT